ncbi:hypothetical protein GEV33_007639 [Tenebrio molitor]|uniref:Uncharacterized protein n=1 Tax=Tenebrio molitor TaxID=7067 RepID=A0A8J6LC14_TENMO|nr:hypothetical protein GEV33_007639 [Tenebrio molitor]
MFQITHQGHLQFKGPVFPLVVTHKREHSVDAICSTLSSRDLFFQQPPPPRTLDLLGSQLETDQQGGPTSPPTMDQPEKKKTAAEALKTPTTRLKAQQNPEKTLDPTRLKETNFLGGNPQHLAGYHPRRHHNPLPLTINSEGLENHLQENRAPHDSNQGPDHKQSASYCVRRMLERCVAIAQRPLALLLIPENRHAYERVSNDTLIIGVKLFGRTFDSATDRPTAPTSQSAARNAQTVTPPTNVQPKSPPARAHTWHGPDHAPNSKRSK